MRWKFPFSDIGAEIHRLTSQTAEKQQEQAVVEAENRVWQHAETIRVDALRDLQSKLQAEHDKQTKRLQKEHEKAIKVSMATRNYSRYSCIMICFWIFFPTSR